MSDQLHHLAAAYALDALDDGERQAFEAHYPGCEICSADVTDHREVAARLASATATEPPADLRAQVLAQIGRTRQLSPLEGRGRGSVRHRSARWMRWSGPAVLAAAAALVVALLGWAAVRNLGDDGGPGADAELVALLQAPDAAVSPLAGSGDGNLNVVWSLEQGRGVVVGADLEPPGSGMVYELWHLHPDGPRPTGLFTPDGSGRVAAGIDVDLDGATDGGWAVTIEPAGGSPQPTGEVLFASAEA